MKTEDHFRKPIGTEAAIIRRLLSAGFPGREDLQQLEQCRVRIIDEDGSLEIEGDPASRWAEIEKRIPDGIAGVSTRRAAGATQGSQQQA